MDLGFGEMEKLIAALHPSVKSSVIAARLKYFQREGFPSEELNVGTGGRASFGVTSLWKLVVVFELLSLGYAPAMASSLVRTRWPHVHGALSSAWAARAQARSLPTLLAVRQQALGTTVFAGVVEVLRPRDIETLLRRESEDVRHASFVNVTRLVRSVADALGALFEGRKPTRRAEQFAP